MKLSWAVLAAALAGLGTLLWSQHWPRYRALQDRGVAAEGWVTAKGLGGRGIVNYSFMVGGKLFSGAGPAGNGAPDYDELSPDDDVIVYYLPSDPDVSSLGDPKEHLRGQNRAILALLAAAAPVLWLSVRRELRSQ